MSTGKARYEISTKEIVRVEGSERVVIPNPFYLESKGYEPHWGLQDHGTNALAKILIADAGLDLLDARDLHLLSQRYAMEVLEKQSELQPFELTVESIRKWLRS